MKIAVIGLGYVGLPLAIALARHFDVTGFDINAARIGEIVAGKDRTGEVSTDALGRSNASFSADPATLADVDVFIVTVPTPVDDANQPDLGPVEAASRTVGRHVKPGAIVIYESTVYPGVTEEICGPILATESGLSCGTDFFLGYSPERINPGDREHTVDRITKVIAGQTPAVTDTLAEIYGAITTGGVFRARDIRTAEAAKVIENAQRDINIAFVNEITAIFHKMDLSVHDVLDAARTKWNFLDFRPGLVGGHCIGVDPYYLAAKAVAVGHDPRIILAGRSTNDGMGAFIADSVAADLHANARVLVMGLTFKENVPDLRNTRVVDIIQRLRDLGHNVTVHDPIADPAEAAQFYGIDLADGLHGRFDAVIGAVAHDAYVALSDEQLAELLNADGILADVKGIWRSRQIVGSRRWQL
ncbi:MAG: nucleotide sugar dehydrogenase [Proteobacteria bacterium]|nr:nucleotide sugar dehydrogenase [Pseudomonadota bacterium]MDA1059066.1 nucleotide sugar dehydrogenase [Pseudomonadota bacterium]